MATFIIFWSALLALLFFVLQAGFKALAAITDALFSSLLRVVEILILIVAGAVIVSTIGFIVEETIRNGFLSALSTVFMLVIELLILWVCVGWLWNIAEGLLEVVVNTAFAIIAGIMYGLAGTCEKKYNYFLGMIIKQTEKG